MFIVIIINFKKEVKLGWVVEGVGQQEEFQM
jgi:hypothetical protein